MSIRGWKLIRNNLLTEPGQEELSVSVSEASYRQQDFHRPVNKDSGTFFEDFFQTVSSVQSRWEFVYWSTPGSMRFGVSTRHLLEHKTQGRLFSRSGLLPTERDTQQIPCQQRTSRNLCTCSTHVKSWKKKELFWGSICLGYDLTLVGSKGSGCPDAP